MGALAAKPYAAVSKPRGIRLAALRLPLVLKLIGANLFVVVSLVALGLRLGVTPSASVVASVGVVVIVHLALVLIALRPIRDLEMTAQRVWRGDYAARVGASPVADREVLRVGSMFNILLDGLASDRARMRALARDVIEAGDRERVALARELQDTTAQHMAALLFEVSTAARDAADPRLAARLSAARDSAQRILDEVRMLSNSVHPSVLGDLGFEAALRKLARDASHGNGIEFDVDVDAGDRLPANLEAVLYRVAQEAVDNARIHAAPKHVRLVFRRTADSILFDVHDDGRGFDLDAVMRAGTHGLRSMRERVALLDGTLEIKTAKGSGTTVTAIIPRGSAGEPRT